MAVTEVWIPAGEVDRARRVMLEAEIEVTLAEPAGPPGPPAVPRGVLMAIALGILAAIAVRVIAWLV